VSKTRRFPSRFGENREDQAGEFFGAAALWLFHPHQLRVALQLPALRVLLQFLGRQAEVLLVHNVIAVEDGTRPMAAG
jgi:hypothetical protein